MSVLYPSQNGIPTILLINLGTPASLDLKDIKAFLSEFLMDEKVIPLPWLFRWLLVKKIIIPFRAKKTRRAYTEIWDPVSGSPLLANSRAFANKLSENLAGRYHVKLSLRYAMLSEENIPDIVKTIDPDLPLIIFPLYPQYSESTSFSSIDLSVREALKNNIKNIKIIYDFYNHPVFIGAQSDIIRLSIKNNKPDFLLFSFHGLPKKQDKNGAYEHQCKKTADAIVKNIGIDHMGIDHMVSFQSRLGFLEWIGPYTEAILKKLSVSVKHLAVVCPSFVSDCLETLEEINLQLRERWFALGGKQFTYIPCVNDSDLWVRGIEKIISHDKEIL